LVFEKSAHLFAKNWQKSQKIVIITSAPGHFEFDFFFAFQFLNFTRSVGNDLSTPNPPHFPGLNPGDRWGLCAGRWFEAFRAGFEIQLPSSQ
jgi:hypothetical protein